MTNQPIDDELKEIIEEIWGCSGGEHLKSHFDDIQQWYHKQVQAALEELRGQAKYVVSAIDANNWQSDQTTAFDAIPLQVIDDAIAKYAEVQ